MFVDEIMHAPAVTCSLTDTLDKVAGLMWNHDCGCVVVVDGDRPIAMITDRDIAMAAYTSGAKLGELRVAKACSKFLHAIHDTDSLDALETLMRDAQVRRVPVINKLGALVGLVTVNDLFRNAATLGRRRHALSAESLVRTLAGIGTPAHERQALGLIPSNGTSPTVGRA
jgi:CBS domain-containing protein